MGLVLEIGVQIRKFMIISKRSCYRSACNHPFLVGMLLFLAFLYRSFPFVFSVLVSASPVLVCTALLLGTLLSFGQSNIPEIEKEEKITHDITSLRTGVSGDDTVVVDRDVSFSTERFSGKARDDDIVDTSLEEASFSECRVSSEVEDHDGVFVPLINDNLQHIQNEKRETEVVERELYSAELENHTNIRDDKLGIEGIEWNVEALEQQYTLVRNQEDEIRDDKLGIEGIEWNVEAVERQYTLVRNQEDEILQVEDDISPRESVYAVAHEGDQVDSSLGGGGGDDEADEDLDDEVSDSESDRAESSSPDASMADILPMLDELHPLLDLEAPQPAHMSHDESDADSDRSNRSNDGSVESDVETESHGGEVEEYGVDYNDGDEKEAQGGKKDGSKSAITWTEDDQNNLMDLGNLELERNQRLEKLIARRRARKILAEKNLIDFDSADLPFNVAPISTARHNPFDPPYDSFDDMGLPPIPGSAPSILLPRRNPFDLPYESNEEKPDLKGDPFEQEFVASHSKDAFFRRHESFSLGPSTLGQAKQERQDFKWRPIFVPERLASEGTSSSLFQRQSSEVSDSKLSSVPDTESVSSAADLDERKFSEQDFTIETEVISSIYHPPDLVEHGSLFCEEVDSVEMGQAAKGDVQPDDLEMKLSELQNLQPSFLGSRALATHVGNIINKIHLKPEPVEEDNSSISSLSSLSEVDERISDVMKVESTSLEARGDIVTEFVISPQLSLEDSEVQFITGIVVDNEHKAPVYDSSPRPTEKILSLNSISSDMQAEICEMVTPPASAEMHIPFVDQDSEVHGKGIEKGTSGYVEISGATSEVHASDEIERGLGTCNQLNQSIISEKKPPSEQEKVLSWSDKSMVEPCFDDHEEALLISEEVDDVKEIDAGLLSELDAVGDFSVKEVVGQPFHADELIQAEENIVSTELGDLNLSDLNLAPPVLEERSIVNNDMNLKQIHRGQGAEEVILPTMVNDQPEVEASANTVYTSSELAIVEAKSLEDIVTALQQVSEGKLQKPSDPEDGSTELPLEYIQSVLKQVSEGNDVGVLPKPSHSKDESEEVGTTAGGSMEETASSDIVSSVQENIAAHTALKQASESYVDELPKPTSNSEVNDVGELPKPSHSKDESEEIGTTAGVSTEETASSDIVSSVPENIAAHTALKQVSESYVDELPKPTSNSEGNDVGKLSKPSHSMDESEEVGTTAVGSTEETASSDIVSSVQENIAAHTALKQVSESYVDELPKPTSNSEVNDVGELPNPSYSKDESDEVGTTSGGSTEETASSDIVSIVQENIAAHTALKQVSESFVDELPKPRSNSEGNDVDELLKPSHSKDESEEVGTTAGGSTEVTASSDIVSSVQENFASHTALKQISESYVDELPKPTPNSEVNDVGELPKPSHSKDESEEVGTTAGGSTEETAPSDIVSSVQENITAHTALKQVSERYVDQLPKPTSNSEVNDVDELPKPSHSKDESEEVGTAAGGSMEETASSVQENVAAQTALKHVSESYVGELPQPTSNSEEGLAEVGPNAADLPTENVRHES